MEAWDPMNDSGAAAATGAGGAGSSAIGGIRTETMSRLRNELRTLSASPLPGIIVSPDENNLLRWHALVTGPSDTPYEGGFFYFLVQVPPDYPSSPPKVKLMTTGGGAVRFNPNLYANGKVCLSIIGTWSGPGWTPSLTLGSVLLSIQSLMNGQPFTNEPGFEAESNTARLQNYNDMLTFETLRVAVIDNVQRTDPMMPSELREAMLLAFAELSESSYGEICDRLAPRLDRREFQDPLHTNKGTYCFAELKARIATLAAKVAAGEIT